jgi:galactokinase
VIPFEQTIATLQNRGDFFTNDDPVYINRAPGRLDLMGGNVDYTGGLVFQATIREATWAGAQQRNDGLIIFSNPQLKKEGWLDRVEFELVSLTDEAAVRRLTSNPELRWTSYVLGLFYWLRRKYPDRVTTGANVYIESDVPLNKGVSSSAAVEVAVMKAVSAAYEIDLNGIELAEACQWAENTIAESACGIMDQAASVLGNENYMLPLRCQPCRPLPLVKLPQGLRCWGIDSGVRHAVTGIEYEAARAAAFVGFQMICGWERLPLALDESRRIPRFVESRWNGYISNISTSIFRSRYEQDLPVLASGLELLALERVHPDPFTKIRPEAKYRIRSCTKYAVEENHRIEMFVELARGAKADECPEAFQLMGELMFQSHWSYTECGLGCDATDLLVDLVRQECGQHKLLGAKITGGGGGGTVAVLGTEDAEDALQKVVERYARQIGHTPYVFRGSSMGADRFGVRVLTAKS